MLLIVTGREHVSDPESGQDEEKTTTTLHRLLVAEPREPEKPAELKLRKSMANIVARSS